MPQRYIGLDKNAPPPLQSVDRRRTECHVANSTCNTSVKDTNFKDKLPFNNFQGDEYDEYNGLPLSSDEEEAGKNDICPTNFARGGNKCSSPTPSTNDSDFRPIRERRVSDACCIPQSKSSPLRRSSRKCSESASSTPKKARLERNPGTEANELGIIFGILGSRPRKKPTTKYSSQSRKQGSRGSQSTSESPSEAVFKNPPKVEVEAKMPDSPEKKFRLPKQINFEDKEPEGGKTLKTFDLRGFTQDVSPVKKFRAGPDLSHLLKCNDDSDPVFRTPTVSGLLEENFPALKDLATRVPLRRLENGEDAQSQPHLFRMPFMVTDGFNGSQVEDSLASGIEDSYLDITPPSPEIPIEAPCPSCGESVDAMFLKAYNNGKRMTIRMQRQFCHTHKEKSARSEWTERGYPTIDWSALDSRMSHHHSYIKELLDGAPSHYRHILDEQVRAGKDRTILQAVKNSNTITPGYYGPRGLRAMSENIISRFSPLLRKIAVQDRLVAARGVTGYVQNVLVPELAVRLIGEDMAIGVEEARQVMRDSADVGDLLSEEVEDVVVWEGEDHAG